MVEHRPDEGEEDDTLVPGLDLVVEGLDCVHCSVLVDELNVAQVGRPLLVPLGSIQDVIPPLGRLCKSFLWWLFQAAVDDVQDILKRSPGGGGSELESDVVIPLGESGDEGSQPGRIRAYWRDWS